MSARHIVQFKGHHQCYRPENISRPTVNYLCVGDNVSNAISNPAPPSSGMS